MFDLLSQAKAKNFMRSEFLSLTEDQPVSEAIKLMNQKNRGCILIVDKQTNLTGIFTERDLLRKVVAKGLDIKKTLLRDCMTTDVIHAQEEEEAIELLETMCEHNFRHVPVLKGKKIVGLITLKQFFKFFLERRRSLGV